MLFFGRVLVGRLSAGCCISAVGSASTAAAAAAAAAAAGTSGTYGRTEKLTLSVEVQRLPGQSLLVDITSKDAV
jgi:hypothetical protein